MENKKEVSLFGEEIVPPKEVKHRPPPVIKTKQVQEIYAAYPRHVGRERAETAIRRAAALLDKRGLSPEWLLARVRKFAASPAGLSGKFTPHCATWMNQGRYDDDDREWQEDEPQKIKPKFKFKLPADIEEKYRMKASKEGPENEQGGGASARSDSCAPTDAPHSSSEAPLGPEEIPF